MLLRLTFPFVMIRPKVAEKLSVSKSIARVINLNPFYRYIFQKHLHNKISVLQPGSLLNSLIGNSMVWSKF